MPPPGGERDVRPPEVIATTPSPLEVTRGFDGPVTFHFNERISERDVRESVMVSPATGDVRVKKGRSEIHVELDGGWKPDQIYRVVLLPGIRDLFGNERREPASLIFSTGPPVPNTAIAGLAYDRLTGRPAEGVIIQATKLPDTVTYSTAGDTSAFFALTHLPLGEYDVVAYLDMNRNRRYDAMESASRPQRVSLAQDRDTMTVELNIVPADTTPAILVGADARDSVDVRLTIDDHLDPDAPLDSVRVALFELPDTVPVAGVPRLMRPDAFDQERRAREDSARADTVAADTAARREPDPAAIAPDPAALDEAGPLPVRELVLIPAIALRPETRYLVRLADLTNVSGVTGGGGEADFETPPRPPPTPPDTAAARPDTTAMRARP